MVAPHVVTLLVRVQIPLVTPKKFNATLADVVIAVAWRAIELGSIPRGCTTYKVMYILQPIGVGKHIIIMI